MGRAGAERSLIGRAGKCSAKGRFQRSGWAFSEASILVLTEACAFRIRLLRLGGRLTGRDCRRNFGFGGHLEPWRLHQESACRVEMDGFAKTMGWNFVW